MKIPRSMGQASDDQFSGTSRTRPGSVVERLRSMIGLIRRYIQA